MKNYIAIEYNNFLERTGRTEIYLAEDVHDAVAKCLYMHKLSDGAAFVGPSKATVYAGDRAYSIVPERKDF